MSGNITSIRATTGKEAPSNSKPPKGAEIISKEVTTETEQIENGFILTKRVEWKYKVKGKDYHDWCYSTKKWYSKTDPLAISLDDKALAEDFEE